MVSCRCLQQCTHRSNNTDKSQIIFLLGRLQTQRSHVSHKSTLSTKWCLPFEIEYVIMEMHIHWRGRLFMSIRNNGNIIVSEGDGSSVYSLSCYFSRNLNSVCFGLSQYYYSHSDSCFTLFFIFAWIFHFIGANKDPDKMNIYAVSCMRIEKKCAKKTHQTTLLVLIANTRIIRTKYLSTLFSRFIYFELIFWST